MRATSLLLVLATAGLAAACGGKPAPEQPAPEPTAAPAPPTPAPVDDSAERERLDRERLAREAASERARAVAADLAAMINFEYDQAAVRSTDQGDARQEGRHPGRQPERAPADQRARGRARVGRVQPRPRQPASGRGQALPREQGHRRRTAGGRLLRRGAPAQRRPRRGGLRPEPSRRVPGDGRRGQPRRSAVSSSNGRLAAGLAATLVVASGLPGCVSKSDVQLVQGEVALLRAETTRRDSTRAAQLGEVLQIQRQIMDSLTASRRAVGQIEGRHLARPVQHPAAAGPAPGAHRPEPAAVERAPHPARGARRRRSRPLRPRRRARAGRHRPAGRRRLGVRRSDVRGVARAAPARQHQHRAAGTPRDAAAAIRRASARPTRCISSARATRRRIRIRPRRTTRRWWTSIPRPPGPPSALYNLGLLAERRKDTAKAKEAYQRVVQKYPQSDEAALARDRLKALGR